MDINGKSYFSKSGTSIGKYKEIPTNNYRQLFENMIHCNRFNLLIMYIRNLYLF
jgi:hypothetical protein